MLCKKIIRIKFHNLQQLKFLSNNQNIFKIIKSSTDITSEFFCKNYERNNLLCDKFNDALKICLSGGDLKDIERHTIRNKKLLVDDRLKLLFDEGEDLLEISTTAGLGLKYGDVPRGGIVAAIGRIHGINCIAVANVATIKAGTIFPITLKKQLRAMQIAHENNLPCVYIVDSGGAFLPLQAEIFQPGGRTFYNQAITNSLDISQLAIVCGSCTAGAAYIPTMSQEAIIVDKIGTIFLAGPPLVQAALGEIVSPEELGGGRMHSSISGCTDYFAINEHEAFNIGRDSVYAFNLKPIFSNMEFEDPLYDSNHLLGIIDQNIDAYEVIARLVDGSRFHEFKTLFGKSIVTGFCHIMGNLVGIVVNNGAITSDAALKASHFIQICSQRNIPLIFLQHIVSDFYQEFIEGKEISDVNLIRSQAKMISSVACASVPIITIIMGNSFGFESYMMASNSLGSRFVFSWPTSKICITDPNILSQYFIKTDKTIGLKMAEKLNEKVSAIYAASNAWNDGIILPQHTRKTIGKCLEIFKQSNQNMDRRQAVMRM